MIVFALFAYNQVDFVVGSGTLVQYGMITFTLVVLVCHIKLCVLQMNWTLIGAAGRFQCPFW